MRDKYITVTALTRYLKKKMDIDPHLQTIFLKGEISNFKHHSRGHMYMTIKDSSAQIRAVMFAGDNQRLKFVPEDGMKINIQGNVTVFEAYGQYQLYIKEMEPDGKGALYLAYEQLKERLQEQGYFNEINKQPIPDFPNHIGVITSPTGAAVRDIITTIKRRFPIAEVTVFPVLVQGGAAINSILDGLKKAQQYPNIDTIIIGRGGGSIEDLWAFNEELVVKAIYHSKIPVITGIGHETDFTISDFTSDLRAPTPTAAAELAVPSLIELKAQIEKLQLRLTREIKLNYDSHKRRVKELRNAAVFRRPMQIIQEKEQQLDRAADQIADSFTKMYKQKKNVLNLLSIHLHHSNPKNKLKEIHSSNQRLLNLIQKEQARIIDHKQRQLYTLIEKLTLLNPLEIMKRGFSITYDDKGELIRSVKKVDNNDHISLKLVDGTIYCSVDEVRRGKHG